AFRELMTYAPLLAETHPAQLARVARRWFLKELPDDTMARWRREAIQQSRRRKEIEAIPPEKRTRFDELEISSPSLGYPFSRHDWDRLSIGADHQGISASPCANRSIHY
ncbi:hypothetical protein ACP3P8_24265, partial [Pseudomonas aeruginosa]